MEVYVRVWVVMDVGEGSGIGGGAIFLVPDG